MISEKIEFMGGGSFFSEVYSADASEYTGSDGSVRWPEHKDIPWCYAYRRYKLSEVPVTDEFGVTETHRSRGEVGPWTYRGNIWSIDDVRQALTAGDKRVTDTLLRNMEGNGWGRVLQCRQGFINIADDANVLPDDEIPHAA